GPWNRSRTPACASWSKPRLRWREAAKLTTETPRHREEKKSESQEGRSRQPPRRRRQTFPPLFFCLLCVFVPLWLVLRRRGRDAFLGQFLAADHRDVHTDLDRQGDAVDFDGGLAVQVPPQRAGRELLDLRGQRDLADLNRDWPGVGEEVTAADGAAGLL